ncbi:MAG: ectoine hydroxylase-related dioxygenase (phytanoyl-CoA dioxygenase family) [Oceanicoccus sp.]|jgi:ectoine hydroxylase-related dioxygenase (phytanoyl-CoA dioxygenase family)
MPLLKASEDDKKSTVDYGDQEQLMQDYLLDGTRRALAMGNRGPIELDEQGRLQKSILDAYWRYGFYVFKNVLQQEELADIETDIDELLQRLPKAKGETVDIHGRRALTADLTVNNLIWVKPLSDPNGATKGAGGRHPIKMFEPSAPSDAPEHVLQLILGPLQFSESHLRLSGHPKLLAVAAAVNGDDFTPFNESIWFKRPKLGASVAWHQDGTMQWDSANFSAGTHGFNFMAQLYGCTAANGVWVVPGSQNGRADIAAMVKAAGSDRLPDAVPLICDPGDVVICNRQAVHGSFANTSSDLRVTLNFGSQRRENVLNAEGNGIHSPKAIYDEERIAQRSKLIAYAIDARKQRYPSEDSYIYRPIAESGMSCSYNENVKRELKDYNLLDLGI